MNDEFIKQAKRDERVNVSFSDAELKIIQQKALELGFNRPETIRYMVREYGTMMPYLLESRKKLEDIVSSALKNQTEAFSDWVAVENECRLLQKELNVVYRALNVLDKEDRERFEKEREKILSETENKPVPV